MFIHEVRGIVNNCTYKPNWTFIVKMDDHGMYIQISVTNSIDSVTKQPCDWKSGKRYLSEFMCLQEIVGVVFDLIKSAEMHELHEWFRYKGASIYNPHLNPEVLVEVARRADSFICRENAMSMKES